MFLERPFIAVNQTACSRLGYSREELLQMGPQDLALPGTLPLDAGKQTARSGGRMMFEAVLVTKEKKQVPVEISSVFVELDGEMVALSSVRDTTEHKRACNRSLSFPA